MPDDVTPGQEPSTTTDPAETPAPVTEVAEPSIDDLFRDPAAARKALEDARKEAAERRVASKPYKEAFEGWDEGSQTGFLNLAKMLVQDPAEAAKTMRQIADELSPAEAAKMLDAVEGEAAKIEAEGESEEDEVDVEALVERKLAEREQKAQFDASVENVIKTTTELGYGPDKGPDHVALLWIADKETGGDLAKAAEKMKARDQAIIDAYLADKRSNADKHITPSSGTTPPAGDAAGKPKTWAEMRERIEQRVDALSRGGD